jgi:hypothetical protein
MSTTKTTHSPLPWTLCKNGCIDDADGECVVQPENMDDARLIYRAVSSHDDLLAACEAVYKSLTQPGAKGNPSAAVMLKQLHAAIAKARNA